jgi:hypothetical protein
MLAEFFVIGSEYGKNSARAAAEVNVAIKAIDQQGARIVIPSNSM